MRMVPFAVLFGAMLLLAACGGDDNAGPDEAAQDPASTATEAPASQPEPASQPDPDPTSTSEPEPTVGTDDAGEPGSADDRDKQAEDEPAPDVDLAPELQGLTDWRNIDPLTLEDLRGQPVVLVFWNSI